jgi:hypothetical protein
MLSRQKIGEPGDNVITFHVRKCNAEGCNGQCNHHNKTDDDASYDSDDSSLSSSDDSSWPGTLSGDLDNWVLMS